jgi:hypothetical protein
MRVPKNRDEAVAYAEQWIKGDLAALPWNLRLREQVHEQLLRFLTDSDPFWPRWVVRSGMAH